MSNAPHPAEIIDYGGPERPDFSYLKELGPVGTSFVDAYTGGDGDPIPPIGAEPADMMHRRPDGMLASGARTADVVGKGAVAVPERFGHDRITIGGAALDYLNAGAGRVYRSTAFTGRHAQPKSLRSHRSE
jgi:hypothetical protein